VQSFCPQCFRLYPEASFETLIDTPVSEIRRVSLATVALRLVAMGIKDLPAFPFLEPPSQQALVRAIETLYNLGAITAECVLLEFALGPWLTCCRGFQGVPDAVGWKNGKLARRSCERVAALAS
jgi:pre-mRNA-splicing factor ATP-dependent RNA helicase-like protein PRP2